jgi:hypothetical protein
MQNNYKVSQKSEVRSQKSEVRSQKSEVRSQKSEVRSQKSEVRSLLLVTYYFLFPSYAITLAERGSQGEGAIGEVSSSISDPRGEDALFPISYYSLPITHYPLLITHYSLPITHYPLLITHYSLPITHYPLLITPTYQKLLQYLDLYFSTKQAEY